MTSNLFFLCSEEDVAVDTLRTALWVLSNKHKQVLLRVSCAEHDPLHSMSHDQILSS